MDLKGAKIFNFFHITSDIENVSESYKKVKVPHYQRPYKWGEELISRLIKDWNEQGGDGYFAGSLVTVVSDTNSHELVDGQQRFTTIFCANYIRYSVLRLCARQAFIQNKLRPIDKLLNDLMKTSRHLYVDFDFDEFSKNKSKLVELFEELPDQNREDKEELIDKLTSDFCELVGLPKMNEGDLDYNKQHEKILHENLTSNDVRLQYDRKSFNDSLISAMAKIRLSLSDQQYLSFNEVSDSNDEVEAKYIVALKCVFNEFEAMSVGKDPFLKAVDMAEKLGKFLNDIKLCVIQTGDKNDAYTLFEVLNDRALALDDLDLIKNQYYKVFCLKNNGLTEDEIDKVIEARETQWGDSVFGKKGDAERKLISFFSASYLTGNKEIDLKNNNTYRERLKIYLEDRGIYCKYDIERDFNLYQFVSVFLSEFNVGYKSRAVKALQAEYDVNKTPVYKLVHLLLALQLESVLSGFLNLIIKYFEVKTSSDFKLSLASDFFKKLALDDTVHTELHQSATKLWQLVLLAPDFKLPREASTQLIEGNNHRTSNFKILSQTYLTDDNKQNFDRWVDDWRYGNNDLKIKVLFARLLRMTKNDDGNLTLAGFQTAISDKEIGSLHLDHMEPSNPDTTYENVFFLGREREQYVNSLGNMFPLPADKNISKSNKPLHMAFSYLSGSGLGDHWLTKEAKSLFEVNSKDNVPDREFFLERKKKIKEHFYNAIRQYK
jgi:uncharacterized protein with ParB-like and HNH nuclease domain